MIFKMNISNTSNLVVYFDDDPRQREELETKIKNWQVEHPETQVQVVGLDEDDVSEETKQQGLLDKLSAAVPSDVSRFKIALISDGIDLSGRSLGFLSVFKGLKTFISQAQDRFDKLFVSLRSSCIKRQVQGIEVQAFDSTNIDTLHSDPGELTTNSRVDEKEDAFKKALEENPGEIFPISKSGDLEDEGFYAFLDQALLGLCKNT